MGAKIWHDLNAKKPVVSKDPQVRGLFEIDVHKTNMVGKIQGHQFTKRRVQLDIFARLSIGDPQGH